MTFDATANDLRTPQKICENTDSLCLLSLSFTSFKFCHFQFLYCIPLAINWHIVVINNPANWFCLVIESLVRSGYLPILGLTKNLTG